MQAIGAVLFDTPEKNFREYTKIAVDAISRFELNHLKRCFINWDYLVPSCSLDGTDCYTDEHRDKDYYSHKTNHTGLRY
jgi:hypothetical protein